VTNDYLLLSVQIFRMKCSVIGVVHGVWITSSMIKSCRILHEMPLTGTDVKLMTGNTVSRSKGTAHVGALGT